MLGIFEDPIVLATAVDLDVGMSEKPAAPQRPLITVLRELRPDSCEMKERVDASNVGWRAFARERAIAPLEIAPRCPRGPAVTALLLSVSSESALTKGDRIIATRTTEMGYVPATAFVVSPGRASRVTRDAADA
jgi:hypothetical protein